MTSACLQPAQTLASRPTTGARSCAASAGAPFACTRQAAGEGRGCPGRAGGGRRRGRARDAAGGAGGWSSSGDFVRIRPTDQSPALRAELLAKDRLADAGSANPFRLPRLHPGIGQRATTQHAGQLLVALRIAAEQRGLPAVPGNPHSGGPRHRV